jgi:hypothetical protein
MLSPAARLQVRLLPPLLQQLTRFVQFLEARPTLQLRIWSRWLDHWPRRLLLLLLHKSRR